MSHPTNTKIVDAKEDIAKEELSKTLMREPTVDEIINYITND